MYQVKVIKPNIWQVMDGKVSLYFVSGCVRDVLIDTGYGEGDLKGFIRKMQEKVNEKELIVVHTHGHFDHVGADEQFTGHFIHVLDLSSAACLHPGVDYQPMNEGQEIDLGDRRLSVFHTPGHTPGSICLLDRQNRIIFSGDNVSRRPVFMCLKGADMGQFACSLRKMLSLAEHYDTVLGGHGDMPLGVEDVKKQIICVDAVREGRAVRKPEQIFDGSWVECCLFGEASVYLPLQQKMK